MALDFFTVTGNLTAVVVDYVDVGTDPDLQKISATVEFRPRLANGELIWASGLTPPQGIALAPIKARFDTDGVLRTIQAAPVNEQQTITITGSPTSYKLAFNSSPASTAIPGGAANTALEAAIEALTTVGVGGVSVAGPTGGPYVVTFSGTLGWQDVPLLTVSAITGGTSPTVTVTTTRPGDLAAGVKLVANTAAIDHDILLYDVRFSNVVYNKADQHIADFAFEAPTIGGITVDLSGVEKLPPKPDWP
jgi:hypothetical protein